MNILLTGGAGFIGSFMTKALLDEGYKVVVVDSLERGYKDVIDGRAKFLEGNVLDKNFIKDTFIKNRFDAVIHFAGYISMGESMEKPSLYFENNVLGALNILVEMEKNKVRNFIFSSSAGVYGNPLKIPIPESNPNNPTNPYGESKLIVEKILFWYNKIHGIKFVSLRYFNAAGGALDGLLGENHKPETHLIPNAIAAALNNTEFTLYGVDYKTKDGTCIRDYIHVLDLVEAHILALNKLQEKGGRFFYNVGTGKGYSNREVLDMVKKISGVNFKINLGPRRAGDAEVLIADPTKIKKELGFIPKYSDLETIVKTAWEWHKKNLEFKI